MAERATRRTPVLLGYVATVAAGALVLVWLLSGVFPGPDLRAVVVFWAMHVAADWTAIRLPQGVLSAGFLVLMTAAFATDPPTAAIVGVLSAASVVDVSRKDGLRAVFNAGQGGLYAGAASVVFHGAAGVAAEDPMVLLAAAALAAGVAFVVNTGLVAGAITLERGREILVVWRNLLWPAPAYFGFAVIALLISGLYETGGVVAATLLLTPMVALRIVHHAYLDLDRAHESTLRAFVRVVEMKDPYTRGHSERVAEIARTVFAALGVRGAELRSRYRGALLHDLGKVGVSGRILAKPGRLSSQEYDAIKEHPGIGARVAEQVGFLRDEVGQIRHHHERMDGTGYPDGLRGHEIPFEARVLAVADAFESMVYPRPYRDALGVEKALEEVARGAGTQFDPIPARALTELVRAGRIRVPAFGSGQGAEPGATDHPDAPASPAAGA